MMKIGPLSSVCEIIMGQAPSGDTYNYEGKGLPLIAGASDLGDRTPTPSRFTTAPAKLSAIGDIIICIRATIGDLNWSDAPVYA
jgi:type I restriction enzyme S subunit